MISQDLLDELKTILKEDFGLELTMEEVSKIASAFVAYFDLLAKVYYESGQKEVIVHEG